MGEEMVGQAGALLEGLLLLPAMPFRLLFPCERNKVSNSRRPRALPRRCIALLAEGGGEAFVFSLLFIASPSWRNRTILLKQRPQGIGPSFAHVVYTPLEKMGKVIGGTITVNPHSRANSEPGP